MQEPVELRSLRGGQTERLRCVDLMDRGRDPAQRKAACIGQPYQATTATAGVRRPLDKTAFLQGNHQLPDGLWADQGAPGEFALPEMGVCGEAGKHPELCGPQVRIGEHGPEPSRDPVVDLDQGPRG